jgi:hypothetical protein
VHKPKARGRCLQNSFTWLKSKMYLSRPHGHNPNNTTHMHISINTLIAIAAVLDFASFIGIVVLLAR